MRIPRSLHEIALLLLATVGITEARDLVGDSLDAVTSDARRTGIVIATEKVMPSVVSITVLQKQTYSSPFPTWFFSPFFPYEYSREIQSLGSGFVISTDGKIVTNAHVVKDASNIKVTLSEGNTYNVRILGEDEALDLALLELIDPPSELKPVILGNSDDIMIGEWAIALGNPLGFLIADSKPSITAGVISATNRRVQTGEGRRFGYSGVIQTDAAINPGNSGGPLVNILGEVIGINTFIFSQSGGSEGLGFAIPVSQAKKFIYELEGHKERRLAWFGMGVQTLTSDMARVMNIPGKKGLVVAQVFPATPASGEGIAEGWIITSANGVNYASQADWQLMEQGLFVGDTMKMEGITDEGKAFSRTLKAVEYTPPEPVDIADLGITVVNVDPIISYRYNIQSTQGVVVQKVTTGRKGAELGLKTGDVILAYGTVQTANINELKSAIHSVSDPRTLVIERDGGRYRLFRGF